MPVATLIDGNLTNSNLSHTPEKLAKNAEEMKDKHDSEKGVTKAQKRALIEQKREKKREQKREQKVKKEKEHTEEKKDKKNDKEEKKKDREKKHKENEKTHDTEEKQDRKRKADSETNGSNGTDAKKPKAEQQPQQQGSKSKVETPAAVQPAAVQPTAVQPTAVPAAASGVSTSILPVDEWRSMFRIEVPTGTPDPYQQFSQLRGCDHIIHKGLANLKYTSPTPIQGQTWPIALTGKDMVGIAETGSGKTIAFLLPALQNLIEKKKQGKLSGKRPHIVIMSPTRELAQQTQEVASKFLAGTTIFSACVYGGDGKAYQIKQLRRGAQLVIATPGRLFDLYGMGHVDFTEVFYVVLDEADRMLDMGFEPQIRQLIELMPAERQTMMFTATFPKEIRALAYSFQQQPVMLKIGTEDLAGNKNITQRTYVVEPFEKYAKLKEVLTESYVDNCRILIFANTKRACDAMAQRLWDEGLPVNAIHGDLDQNQRNKAIQQFKDGSLPILFATDVAARGLDIKNVKHVINADFPNYFENYVHRIGRTGRAGEKGVAHSLVCLDSDHGLSDLVRFLDQCSQEVPTALRDRFGAKSRSNYGGGGYRGRGGRGGFRGPSGSRFDRGARGGRGGGRGGFGGGFGGGRGGGGGFGGSRGGFGGSSASQFLS